VSNPYEKLILNPVEFTPGLPEIDLSAMGIAIGSAGPDYGESSVIVERVKRAIGEGVTSAHWPSVECSVPLVVSSDPAVSQASAYQPIEAFVAEVQRRSRGWIRRDFADAAGFSGSVGCPVDAAALSTPKGLGQVDEITLKLSRSPIWYATAEGLAGEAKGSAIRDLVIELAELLGTAPGLICLQVQNEGTEDWRGCLVSIECDDYSSASTALPKYEAQQLTPGGSEIKEVSGAKVVKCPPLSLGFQQVLSSKIAGIGHMTHIGPRRMAFRIEDPTEKTDAERLEEWVQGGEVGEKPQPLQVQWALEWRALGATRWTQTSEGSTPLIAVAPVVGAYQLIDLGECRPERPVEGEPRFEWRLMARSPGNKGQQPLIRDVYPLSTEQWMRVTTPAVPRVAEHQVSKIAGTGANAEGKGTVGWENATRVTASDNSYATAKLGPNIQSEYLKATNFGFAIPTTAVITGVIVAVERIATVAAGTFIEDASVQLVKGGVIGGFNRRQSGHWATGADEVVYHGGAEDLWGRELTPSDVNSTTFGTVVRAVNPTSTSAEATAKVDSISIMVFYAEGADENRVCFASRSIEFTNTGIRRQHPTDEVWGELIHDGFLPYAPPSGQGDQSVRVLIISSVGDLGEAADSAAVKISAKVLYRPGYLFAREAA
jgi:hypothetical protein